MSWPSWVGSVWGLRGAEGSVVGQVRGVDGGSLVLTVAGLGTEAPEGIEVLGPPEGHARSARIPVAALLARWDRITGSLSRFLAAPHRAAG